MNFYARLRWQRRLETACLLFWWVVVPAAVVFAIAWIFGGGTR